MLRVFALLAYVSHLFLCNLGPEATPPDANPSLPSSDQGSGWDPWG